MMYYQLHCSPPLSADEERQLLTQAQAGCQESTTQLLNASSPLLLAFAEKCSSGIPRDEVLSEATFILLRCVKVFPASASCRFNTYVHAALQKSLPSRVTRQQPQHFLFSDVFPDNDGSDFAGDLPDNGTPAPTTAITAEQRRQLGVWLDILDHGTKSEQQAAYVIRRRCFGNASWQEIRNELALSATVKVTQLFQLGERRLAQMAKAANIQK